MAVDEYQPAGAQAPESEFADCVSRETVARGLENRLERQLRDRGHVGKAPILVLERRKAEFGKPRQARLAQRENPGRLLRFFFKPLELFQIRIGFFQGRVWHRPNHSRCCFKSLLNSQSNHSAWQLSHAPSSNATTQSTASRVPKEPWARKTNRAARPSSNRSASHREIRSRRLPRVGPGGAAGCGGAGGCPSVFGSPLPRRKRAAMPGVRLAGSGARSPSRGGPLAPFIKLPSPRPNADFETGALTFRRSIPAQRQKESEDQLSKVSKQACRADQLDELDGREPCYAKGLAEHKQVPVVGNHSLGARPQRPGKIAVVFHVP